MKASDANNSSLNLLCHRVGDFFGAIGRGGGDACSLMDFEDGKSMNWGGVQTWGFHGQAKSSH